MTDSYPTQCVLLSIRLSPPAIRHLLEQTHAKTVIVSSRTYSIVQHALSGSDLLPTSLVEAVPLKQLLSPPEDTASKLKNHLVSTRHLIREDDCNVLVLHSSGTTGLPKAIRLTHRYMLGYAACHDFPANEDESMRGTNLSTLPLFHGFGLLAPCLSLSLGKPLCLPPASAIPSGQLVRRLLQNHEITSLMSVPTILEEITEMSDFELAAKDLARLDMVVSGGGGLSLPTGSQLSANGVTILNHFGATELGALAPISRPGKDYDWRYIPVRKDLGLRLEPLEDSDEEDEACKLIGRPFGWAADFELQDHLRRNPSHPDSEVMILGRKDDVIVLATGEKVLPHTLEQKLAMNPLIKCAVVFGSGRFEVGVLVEPSDNTEKELEEIVDSVWSEILEINKLVDQHARIRSKAAVIVATSGKAIPRSDKGTPQRREVYVRFEPEIESVYESLRQADDMSVAHAFDPEDPSSSLRAIVQTCLPEHQGAGDWADEEDLVNLGLDSLQAKRLHQIIRQALQACGRDEDAANLQPDFVYTNSSVKKMAKALSSLGNGSDLLSDTMETLTAKYSYDSNDQREGSGNVVALTGSTGNLGAHLLQLLTKDSKIRQIICFVRDNTSKDPAHGLMGRQKEALKARGISLTEREWRKISLVPWIAGNENLGIKPEEYMSITRSVTHVLHAAWPMDFRRKLASFEAHIKAVRDLVELCRAARRLRPAMKPRFLLVSSIAVVGNYHGATEQAGNVVPEIPVPSASTLDISYAEAKWVCEQIVQSASHRLECELSASIVRLGQVTGTQSSGYWTVKEHFPALVKASQEMGRFPDLQGSLSWLPVDRAAQIFSELLLHTGSSSVVYHLENPVRQPWSDVRKILERKLDLRSLPPMPFEEWLAEAKNGEYLPTDLLAFLETHFVHMSGGSLVLDTRNCRMVSRTCRSSNSVSVKEIERYVDFWKSEGFLR